MFLLHEKVRGGGLGGKLFAYVLGTWKLRGGGAKSGKTICEDPRLLDMLRVQLCEQYLILLKVSTLKIYNQCPFLQFS